MSVAADLLAMYAERVSLTRPPCAPDSAAYADFEKGFDYAPTPDQISCFEDVRADMTESDRPMDR
jgi:transcription-repair coupling factor (superfamily II helicase)